MSDTVQIDALRMAARTVLDNFIPKSALPPRELSNEIVISFVKERQAEFVAEVRPTLNDAVSTLSSDVILRFLFGKVTDEEAGSILALQPK